MGASAEGHDPLGLTRPSKQEWPGNCPAIFFALRLALNANGEIDNKRQMIGCHAGYVIPDNLDPAHANLAGCKNMIDAQHGKARRKCRLWTTEARCALDILHASCKSAINIRPRNKIQIANESKWAAALGMSDPVGPEKKIGLPPSLACDQRQMRVDDIQMQTIKIDPGPKGAARLNGPQAETTGQTTGMLQAGWKNGQYGVAILLFHDPDIGMEM